MQHIFFESFVLK